MASILVYRCVGQALARSFDPRDNLKEFRWDVLSDGLFTADDLKMVWFFIKREVSYNISGTRVTSNILLPLCYTNELFLH